MKTIILAAATGFGLAVSAGPATAATATVPGTTEAFNPQPEPPAKRRFVSPGERKGFNPQPEPPARKRFVAPGSREGFNPQPEPPPQQKFGQKVR